MREAPVAKKRVPGAGCRAACFLLFCLADRFARRRERGRGRGRGLQPSTCLVILTPTRVPMPMPCKHLHPHLTSPSNHTSIRTERPIIIVPFESSDIGGFRGHSDELTLVVCRIFYHSTAPAALLALTEALPGWVSPLRVVNVPDCTFSATVKTRATRANKHVPISATPLHTESTHTERERCTLCNFTR